MKRLISAALVAVLAFGVQVAYGAPARNTQTVRAVWCCSTRCDHPMSASAASRCCGIAGGGSELAASTQTNVLERGPATQVAHVELHVLPKLEGHGSGWAGALPATRVRGAPLFLLTHSLRI